MNSPRGLLILCLGLLGLAAVAAADMKQDFNLTYTTYPLNERGAVNRGESPTRHFYKGHRSRIDNFSSGGSQPRLAQSFIMDCDSSRMITIDWQERTYTLMTFAEFQRMQEQMMRMASRMAGQMSQIPGMGGPRPQEGATGGVVTVTTTWRDSTLDERKFGLPVRWVSMAESRDASEDACYPDDSNQMTQRWVTDLDLPLCVPPFDVTAMSAAFEPPAPQGCEDRVETKVVGTPRPLGFILREWNTAEDGSITGYEVVELSRAELADSLFVPPTGFRLVEIEMPSDADMDQAVAMGGVGAAAAPPKAEGAIRVGVSIQMEPGSHGAPAPLAAEVAEWIRSQGLDAVPLAAQDRAAALAEAPTVQADYVLFYDLDKAQAKVSGRGMLGAALGGSLGERAAGGAMQLEVEGGYVLLRPSGEEVTDGQIEEKERAEDPQAQLAVILEEAAGQAIRAIPR